MIKVKYTPKGVLLISEAVEGVMLCDDPKELQKLIDKLQEAKANLVECQARIKEEGQQQLWEGV